MLNNAQKSAIILPVIGHCWTGRVVFRQDMSKFKRIRKKFVDEGIQPNNLELLIKCPDRLVPFEGVYSCLISHMKK